MRAVRCREGKVELVQLPQPQGDGVRVRIRSAGICGSDLHLLGSAFAPKSTLGHEMAGTTPDGRRASGRLATAVVAKSFPTEELSVASEYVTPPPEVEERLARERAKLAAIYAARSPYPAPVEPFVRPVPGEPTSVFGTRRLYNGEPRSPHPGLDLRAATGDGVVAAGAGTVSRARPASVRLRSA